MRSLKQKSYVLGIVLSVGAALGFMAATQVGCKKAGGGVVLPTTLQELIEYASSPQELLDWMRSNISYGWPGYPDMNTWYYLSPQEVFSQKRGDCTAQAGFEAYILKHHGYDCHLLWLERTKYSDHGVCYWRQSGLLYYMEHAFGGYEGIYGPFNLLQEIGAQIYARMVANDGNTDSYTLYHFDNVPYGVDWVEFHALLSPI